MIHQAVRSAAAGFSAVALFFLAGCGGGLNTSPVSGKVVVEGDDLKILEGTAVEFHSKATRRSCASGEIQADGSFQLSTLYNGNVQEGATEGTHLVRILHPDYEGPDASKEDEDDLPPALRKFRKVKTIKKKPIPIPEKYLNFQTSGWKVTVPTDGSVTLTIKK